MNALRRHHRDRVIQRQLEIARFVTGEEYWRKPGHLTKGKAFRCSCPMCTSPVKRPDDFRLAEEIDVWGLA